MKTRQEQTKAEIERGRAVIARYDRAKEIADWVRGSPAPNPQLLSFLQRAEEAGVKTS